MSRVHEALRRAEQAGSPISSPKPPQAQGGDLLSTGRTSAALAAENQHLENDLLSLVRVIPFRQSDEAMLIDPTRPNEAPTEEFRTLRTRLNHMQSCLLYTSPSPRDRQKSRMPSSA